MAGRKKWSQIKGRAAPETLEAAARKKEALLASMELNELRLSLGVTQEELAERLGRRQATVSQMERRTDMHISTLKEVVEALGGELVITAHFPDRDVRLDQFEFD
jgi:transcriptional regulator with XRE-family HTH domain